MLLRLMDILVLSMLLLVSACSGSGTSTPALNSDGTYALETRTGIEDIDNVLAAVENGDRSQLESLIRYTTAPCTTLDGLGGPPKCREEEPEGTLLEVLPSIGSEGSFVRKTEIHTWSGVDADALFAVYRVSEDGVEEEYYPRGEYAVVLLSSGNAPAVNLRIRDGGIVRIDYPFYETLEDLNNQVEQDASEVILMPNIR